MALKVRGGGGRFCSTLSCNEDNIRYLDGIRSKRPNPRLQEFPTGQFRG